MILALDPSTVALGFAFGGIKDNCPKGGTYPLPGASDQVFDRTLAKATETVEGLLRLTKAQRLCIEAPILVNNSDHGARITMCLIQLAGALRAVGARAHCEVTLIAVNTVRKHFIGRGNLPSQKAKLEVMARCDTLGWSYVDDNNSDALAVWSWAMSTYCPKWSPKSTPLFRNKEIAR